MKNEDDDECFKWCVTRVLNAVDDHPERITETLKRRVPVASQLLPMPM